jgi:hypothetical protein
MEEGSPGKRQNPDQIPRGNDTQSETGRIVSEQAGVQGQRKEVNVEGYSKVAEIGQILKDMDFPADKNKIISLSPSNKLSQTTKIKRIYFRPCKILKSENTRMYRMLQLLWVWYIRPIHIFCLGAQRNYISFYSI